MNSTIENIFLLLAVIAAHFASLAVAFWMSSPKSQELVLPVIQGILLPMPPTEKVQLPSAKMTPTTPKPVIKKSPKKPRSPSIPAITQQKETPEEITSLPTQSTPMMVEDNNTHGAGITSSKMDANPLNNPAPAYPSLSRRLKEEGIVLLEILILPDGTVGKVRLKQSSGFPRLDKTAIKAIKQWRYQPARQNNHSIEYWYLQPLEFSLK